MVNHHVILKEEVPGIDWFVPADYQPYFISELLDVYICDGDDGLFETDNIGIFHDLTPELAGLFTDGDVNFYFYQAEELYQTEDDRHEYIMEVKDLFSEEMEEVCNRTLDFYHMTYQYRSIVIRHYAKEVW